jgi:hypothetical protein
VAGPTPAVFGVLMVVPEGAGDAMPGCPWVPAVGGTTETFWPGMVLTFCPGTAVVVPGPVARPPVGVVVVVAGAVVAPTRAPPVAPTVAAPPAAVPPAAAPPDAPPPAVCAATVKVKISPQAPTNRQMLLCMWQQTPLSRSEQSHAALKSRSGPARKRQRKTAVTPSRAPSCRIQGAPVCAPALG